MSTAEIVRKPLIEDIPSHGSHQPAEEEIVVMQLVAGGLKDHAIARRLGVSIVTVRRRARRFRNKLGAANRSQAIAVAASRGWLKIDAQGASDESGSSGNLVAHSDAGVPPITSDQRTDATQPEP